MNNRILVVKNRQTITIFNYNCLYRGGNHSEIKNISGISLVFPEINFNISGRMVKTASSCLTSNDLSKYVN